MTPGATRFLRLGEEEAGANPLSEGGQFIVQMVNKATGTQPEAPPEAHDSGLVTFWRSLGPPVQTTIVVLGGLFAIRVVRGVL